MHRRPFCGHTLLVPLCSASIAMPTQEHPMAFDSDQPRCSCSVFKYLLYQNEGVSMTHCVHRGGKLQYKRAKKKERWSAQIMYTSSGLHAASQTSHFPFMSTSIDIKASGFPLIPGWTLKANRWRSQRWVGEGERERERSSSLYAVQAWLQTAFINHQHFFISCHEAVRGV